MKSESKRRDVENPEDNQDHIRLEMIESKSA
jgi:hypothetical protein